MTYTVTVDLMLFLTKTVEADSAEQAEEIARAEVAGLIEQGDTLRLFRSETVGTWAEAPPSWELGAYMDEDALDPETLLVVPAEEGE